MFESWFCNDPLVCNDWMMSLVSYTRSFVDEMMVLTGDGFCSYVVCCCR